MTAAARLGLGAVVIASLAIGCAPEPLAPDAKAPTVTASPTTASSGPNQEQTPDPEPVTLRQLRRYEWLTRGDFDGDGLRDSARIETRDGGFLIKDRNPARIVVSLGSGQDLVTGWRLRYPGSSLFGAYDVDGGGADELFVHEGGETVSLGYLLTLRGSLLRIVKEHRPQRPPRPFSFNVDAHSNGVPMGTADVECRRYLGRPSLLQVSTWLTVNSYTYKELRQSPRAWELSAYVMKGRVVTRVARTAGVAPPGAWPPPPVPHRNALRCGGPRKGAGSG